MDPSLIAIAAVAAVGWVALAAVLVALRRRSRERSPEQPTGDNGALRRLDHELRAATEFVRYLPEALTSLRTLEEVRAVPEMLLHLMVRTFGADDAVVAVRRQVGSGDPRREARFVVAASVGSAPPLGTEILEGEGHIGLVARRQLALDREHYLRLAAGAPSSRGPVFDAAAPMVVDDETIGVMAFGRPLRHHRLEQEMLRALAQLGALTWFRVRALRQVRDTAEQDGLTGLLNKRAITERLSDQLQSARSGRTPLSVFLFDIDHFKHYNDLNGHLAGDQVLRTLAELLRDEVRVDGSLGRFGGEEFLLLLNGQTRAQATIAAERLRRKVAAHGFDHGARQPGGRLTISGGVACYPADAEDVAGLLHAADLALYGAKAAGRNRVLAAEVGLPSGG